MAQTPQKPAVDEDSFDLAAAIRTASTNGGDSNVLGDLVKLLLVREARAVEKDRAEEIRLKAKDEAARRDSISYSQDMIRKQRDCTHLKGGAQKMPSQVDDYNVYHHKFIDGKQWVKCNSCSAKWMPEDTSEFFVRGKKSYVNHTGLGWKDALRMAAKSSNRASASEIPFGRQTEIEPPKSKEGKLEADVIF